jgi:hypothetical protein
MTADGVARGELVEPSTTRSPWLGAGLGGRLGFRIAGSVFAEVEAGLTTALLRRSYVFDNPREIVHTTPLLVPSSRVGFGVTLP